MKERTIVTVSPQNIRSQYCYRTSWVKNVKSWKKRFVSIV